MQASFPKKLNPEGRPLSRRRPLGHIWPTKKPQQQRTEPPSPKPQKPADETPLKPREIGGPKGPEPTRYGDWEVGGRCIDF